KAVGSKPTGSTIGGGFLIIKISKTKNAANNQPTKKEKKPTLPKDNPPPKPNTSPTPNPPQPNPIPKPNNPPQPNNDEYPAITATGREPEYRINNIELTHHYHTPGHLTAGSALLTDTLDGSGNGSSILNDKGITHLIHAVNQPFTDRYQFEKLAIPLVGGGIFLGNCDPQKLAEGIVRGVVNQLEKCQNLKRISLIDWDGNPNSYLLKAFESEFMDKDELFAGAVARDNNAFGKLKSNPEKLLGYNKGDICNKSIHGASVIVNAANTQVKFGGGISGAVAEQVGDKKKIEAKAQELIDNHLQEDLEESDLPFKVEVMAWDLVNQLKNIKSGEDIFTTAANNLQFKPNFINSAQGMIDDDPDYYHHGLLIKDTSQIEKNTGTKPEANKFSFKVLGSKVREIEGYKPENKTLELEIATLDLGIEGMPLITRIFFNFLTPDSTTVGTML
ncbi:201_t:CDS:2, partial [Ambispora leptoticha]